MAAAGRHLVLKLVVKLVVKLVRKRRASEASIGVKLVVKVGVQLVVTKRRASEASICRRVQSDNGSGRCQYFVLSLLALLVQKYKY